MFIRMIRIRMFRVASLVLIAMFAAAPAQAQEGGDLQAQILYAFHTEDTHQLGNLVQSLTTQVKAGGASASLHYHLAHALYRFGLLMGDSRSGNSGAAFVDCIDELKPVLEEDVKSAEALILQYACYANLAKYRRLEAVVERSHAADRLAKAFALAPRNPRVLYFKAMDGLAHAKPGSPENNQAFAELQQAAQLFEQSSATREDVPGWGHAEAYLALGMQLEQHGDLLGARNWIEKSLIVAPDYKKAQRELASLVRR